MVSARVGAENLVLGQLATEKKSNEITAIPQLLDTIDIQGDTVTIDAMGCQREIARKIRKKGADYVLMVKENHPLLYQEIADCFSALDSDPHKHEQCTEWESGSEKDHGRIERRKITIPSADWYEDGSLWTDLKT